MERTLQDIRFALRSLVKARGFAAIALVTLALGIGMATALLSVVDAVLLARLPFWQPDRLVRLTADFTKRHIEDIGMSVPELEDFRRRAGVFQDVAGLYPININLTGVDEPERIEAQLVSANFFTLLGARPQIGRIFTAADHQPHNVEIAVITDSLWTRRFSRDPHILGRKILVDNDPYEIVGVLEPGFRHPGRGIAGEPELFGPSGYGATPFPPPARAARVIAGGAIARLAPGVSIEDAQRRLAAFGTSVRADSPADYPETLGWAPRVLSLHLDLVERVRPALLVLLAGVAAVLLIACANVANLMIARASSRAREFALRGALGASRGRLARQMLTESAVLSLSGGLLGIVLGRWMLAGLTALIPAALPRAAEIAINGRVLWMSLALAVGTGLLFGLWPALQASPTGVYDTLKDAGRGQAGSRRRTRLRGALVVIEFALALVLLVTAALFVRSFLRLYDVSPGFEIDRLATARLWMPLPNDPSKGPYTSHQQRLPFFQRTSELFQSVPGVTAAGWVSRLPLGGVRGAAPFLIEGQPPETAIQNSLDPLQASPGYFAAMGITVIQGRVFNDQDTMAMPGVVVISETFAKRYFPNQDPINRRIRPGGPASTAPWLTIVGVVSDVRSVQLDAEPTAQMYRCLWQSSSLTMALVARTVGEPGQVEPALRNAIKQVDPNLPLFAVQPMTIVVASTLAQRRFAMIVIGIFAALALLLSAVGIYGVLSYLVQQRTSEIGLRMAMGASPQRVLGLILGEGLFLAAIGIAIGLAGAALATRAVSGMLFGVGPFDLASFAGISALLLAVAAIACALPAWRALRVDPLTALRQD